MKKETFDKVLHEQHHLYWHTQVDAEASGGVDRNPHLDLHS